MWSLRLPDLEAINFLFNTVEALRKRRCVGKAHTSCGEGRRKSEQIRGMRGSMASMAATYTVRLGEIKRRENRRHLEELRKGIRLQAERCRS